jgi:hypothetical protein
MRYMEVVMRGSSALVMLIVLFCVRLGGKSTGLYPEEICIVDKGHIWTEPVNGIVHESEKWLNFFQISSSGMMDLVMINYLIWFYFKARNGHTLWTVAIFYGTRAIIQGNFKMRFPDKGIWDDPGIPSLVVPYGLQSDYYFSGHCGFLAIQTINMANVGRKYTAVAIAIAIPYVAYTLIMTRIHYTIDIPIGIMYGCYLYIMIEPHVKKMDYYISRFTMAIKKWLCGE